MSRNSFTTKFNAHIEILYLADNCTPKFTFLLVLEVTRIAIGNIVLQRRSFAQAQATRKNNFCEEDPLTYLFYRSRQLFAALTHLKR